jgi:hypothetical protein
MTVSPTVHYVLGEMHLLSNSSSSSATMPPSKIIGASSTGFSELYQIEWQRTHFGFKGPDGLDSMLN